MITYILTFISLALLLTLIFVLKKAIEYRDKLETLVSQIEESLDIIDLCYQKITKVSGLPIAIDDPIVQQLVSDIKETKGALLLIANMIVEFDETDE